MLHLLLECMVQLLHEGHHCCAHSINPVQQWRLLLLANAPCITTVHTSDSHRAHTWMPHLVHTWTHLVHTWRFCCCNPGCHARTSSC